MLELELQQSHAHWEKLLKLRSHIQLGLHPPPELEPNDRTIGFQAFAEPAQHFRLESLHIDLDGVDQTDPLLPRIVVAACDLDGPNLYRKMRTEEAPAERRSVDLVDSQISQVLERWAKNQSALGLEFVPCVFDRDGKIKV